MDKYSNNARIVDAIVEEECERYRHRAIVCLGARCAQCGFDVEDALQIDHPLRLDPQLGDDPQPPYRTSAAAMAMYFAIIEGDETNVQLLCGSCYAIKTKREDRLRDQNQA